MDEAGYFDSVAEKWDELREGYFGEKVLEGALNEAELAPGLRVIDVGTGTGYLALGAARKVRWACGVDRSLKMLSRAKEKATERAVDNLALLAGDFLKLPFRGRSAERVLANMVLHHSPEPEAAISEMARLLTPGGVLVVSDLVKHPHEWFREEMADLWLGFKKEEVRRWLRGAGLVGIRVRDAGARCQTISRAQVFAGVSIFLARGVKRKG